MVQTRAKKNALQENITTPLVQLNDNNPTIGNKDLIPTFRSKPTGKLMNAVKAEINLDEVTKTGAIALGDVVLTIRNFESLKGAISVSTDKLLRLSIALFTQTNSKGNINDTLVSIPLKNYASLCGYDVQERPGTTPEEIEKEALRISNVLRDVRKKVNKDLNILYEMSATWDEKINGKPSSFDDIRLVQSKGIKGGYINIRLGQDFAEYLGKCAINFFSLSLLSLDERNSNSYCIGLKIVEQYSIINNEMKGTSELLKVKTLLGVTSLPTIEKCKANRTSWVERIKEPFEKALEILIDQGVLEKWDYCYPSSGGEVLLDKDSALLVEDYTYWENTIVAFKLKNPLDRKEAVALRENRLKEAKKKKPSSSKKKNGGKQQQDETD